MPERRNDGVLYGLGGEDSSKPNNNLLKQDTRIVSDEELAEEAVTRDILEKADALIDKNPKAFLKRLVKRLIAKGLLP